ncbi:single-stranded DNA-binding protein [Elusimicrobiota bacterium]
MASNANLVVIMGNLTRDPDLRYTPQGRPIATLSLALNRRYKDRETGEYVEKTDFIPVSVWGTQAENCDKYLSKGRGVYVQGRLTQNKWENANGESRSRLEVVAENVQFLPSSRSADAGKVSKETDPQEEEVSQDESGSESEDSDDEEIPF